MDEAIIEDDEMDDDGWCVDCGDEQGDVLDGDEWVCRECLLVRYHKSCEEIQRLAAEVERYESMQELRRFDRAGRDVTELTGLWDDDDSFDFRPLRDKKES